MKIVIPYCMPYRYKLELFLFSIIIAIHLVAYCRCAIANFETRLLVNITDNYCKEARPVLDNKSPVNVSFGLEFIQLIKVDERNQNIKNKVWIRLQWVNELIKWDVQRWGNVTFAQMDPGDLWTPDIVLYNNVDDESEGNTDYKTRINIYPNGTHLWQSPASFTSTCQIDVKAFPYDIQHCYLKFGSWTFDASKIYLVKDNGSLITDQYVNSSEWDILSTAQQINTRNYSCCPNPYMDVTFNITMMRKPLYYLFNVIAPCIVLVTTVLFSFFLPPESGERISLTLTVLLAFAVFLNMISGKLPRNSDTIPMLAKFFVVMMAESAFSLVTTCIVLVVHYRSGANLTALPGWARQIFIIRLGSILRINQSSFKDENGFVFPDGARYDASGRNVSSRKDNDRNYSLMDTFSETGMKYGGGNSTALHDLVKPTNGFNSNSNNDGISRSISNENKSTLNDILDEVRVITNTIREQTQTEQVQEEWQLLGKILDRLFFVVFLFTVTISAISILMPVYLDRHLDVQDPLTWM